MKTNMIAKKTEPGVLVGERTLKEAVDRLAATGRPRYVRLWTYYQNPMRACGSRLDQQGSDRPYRQGQEWGMPSRITGVRAGADVGSHGLPVDGVSRKEVVVENDIGWRVETMVDYLFGKPITLHSTAPDERRRAEISQLLRLIVAHNGGILFLQQMALLGCVYGFVDVLVKFVPNDGAGTDVADTSASTVSGTQSLGATPAGNEQGGTTEGTTRDGDAPKREAVATGSSPSDGGEAAPESGESSRIGGTEGTPPAGEPPRELQRIARMIRLEIVEPARALPFVSDEDWRVVRAYGQCIETKVDGESDNHGGWRERVTRWFSGGGVSAPGGRGEVVELITPTEWQRVEAGKVVARGANTLGRIPLVHIQNLPVPFQYGGTSDVEPLIPLQDELNTRLSDRANRITLQSFKMYVGKNIDGFGDSIIAPGKMWQTDNPDAEVITFGGDPSSPSEDAHIADLREAMDKSSGVSPIAAGAIKNRIGNLTSAAALRITLFSLLSKNDRKRTTYGAGLQRMCELALAWLDHAGVYRTTEAERGVEIHWPSPLPANEMERLQEAEMKLKVGVGAGVVLKELGY